MTRAVRSLMRRLRQREAGLSMVELLVAMTLLSMLVLLSIGPTMSSMNSLRRSKVLQLAENIGQGKIEEIRSLTYSKVGVVFGNPPGILNASETKTIQGVAFTVTTDVDFAGSSTSPALNVIPQGGDGVQGFWDSGVNYKRVLVTVTHNSNAITPVQFETLVAPPSVAAHEGYSNVQVNLLKIEPLASDPADWPVITIIKGGTVITYGDVPTDTQPFIQVEPSEGTPWVARMGTNMADVQEPGASPWRISKQNLDNGSDRVLVDPMGTATINLKIYKPIQTTVRVTSGGAPVTTATVKIKGSSASAPWETYAVAADGTIAISSYNGEPMPPGDYTIDSRAIGFNPDVRTITVPPLYPNVLTHLEDVVLTPIPTSQITVNVFHLSNNPIYAMANANVEVTDLTTGAVTNIKTNGSGQIVTTQPQSSSYQIRVTTNTGHATWTWTGALSADTTHTALMQKPAASGWAIFELHAQSAASGAFGYRRTTSEEWVVVTPNASLRAAIVVRVTGFSSPVKYWVSKMCIPSQTVMSSFQQNPVQSNQTYTWGATSLPC